MPNNPSRRGSHFSRQMTRMGAEDGGPQDEMEIDDVGPLASSTTIGTRPISRAAPLSPNGAGHLLDSMSTEDMGAFNSNL
jgi:hypothetical protein